MVLAMVMIFMAVACDRSEARSVRVHDMVIEYDSAFQPNNCGLLLRHPIGPYGTGAMGPDLLCDKYRKANEDDVIDTLPASFSGGAPDIPVKKRDYIPLDGILPWTGVPPFRAAFSIRRKVDDPDPDPYSLYLPYERWNKVTYYFMVDKDGYEVDVASRKRTGYRFYGLGNNCYLATEKIPRKYKHEAICDDREAESHMFWFPPSVDIKNRPWINITPQNTVDVDEDMPYEVGIFGNSPVKPLIYSDYPITDDGRVSKGRAMCMADCPDGMLMKLLHKGQSIWGKSGKPSHSGR